MPVDNSDPQDNTGGIADADKKDGSEDTPKGDSKETSKGDSQKDTKEDSEGDKKAAADKAALENAPEKYTDFTIPKGVELGDIEGFRGIGKELNLSQEKAQKLIDFAVKNAQVSVKAEAEEFDKTKGKWEKEVKDDKDLGGKNYDETMLRAKRAVKGFASEGLQKLMRDTGFDFHPEWVRLFAKIDKATQEDTPPDGSSKREEGKTDAQILFPKTNR